MCGSCMDRQPQVGRLLIVLYAVSCYFWMHQLHADCTFNFFLPYTHSSCSKPLATGWRPCSGFAHKEPSQLKTIMPGCGWFLNPNRHQNNMKLWPNVPNKEDSPLFATLGHKADDATSGLTFQKFPRHHLKRTTALREKSTICLPSCSWWSHNQYG